MTDDEPGGLDELLGSWVSDPIAARKRWEKDTGADTTDPPILSNPVDLRGAGKCDEGMDGSATEGIGVEAEGTPEGYSGTRRTGQEPGTGDDSSSMDEASRQAGDALGRTPGNRDAASAEDFNAVMRLQEWIDRHVGPGPDYAWIQCGKETCKCSLPGWKPMLRARLEKLEIASWRLAVSGTPENEFVRCRECQKTRTLPRIALRDWPSGRCEICTDPDAPALRRAIDRAGEVFATESRVMVAVMKEERG